MNTPRLTVFAVFAALSLVAAVSPGRGGSPASPLPARETVYVTIEYFDPIRFDRMRYALMTGEELILSTLKSSAMEQARFAAYTGEVVVLDEKAKAPDGATVLTLTWNGQAVAADVVQKGRSKYLGIVNRLPLSYHPDFTRMRQTIDHAGLPDAHRDAVMRAEVQMDLFMALKYLVRYQKDHPVGG